VLLSSHVLEDIERTCDEVVVLAGGRLTAQQAVTRRESGGPVSLQVTGDADAFAAPARAGRPATVESGRVVWPPHQRGARPRPGPGGGVRTGVLSLVDAANVLEDAVGRSDGMTGPRPGCTTCATRASPASGRAGSAASWRWPGRRPTRALGLRRTTGSKVWPFLLIGAAHLPAVAAIGVPLLFEEAPPPLTLLSVLGHARDHHADRGRLRRHDAAVAADARAAGPGAQPVLLDRGVAKEYLAGKVLTAVGLMSLVTLSPLLLLLVGSVLTADTPLTALREDGSDLPVVVLAGLVAAVFFAALGLLAGSLTAKRVFAVGGLLAVLLVTPVLAELVAALTDRPAVLAGNLALVPVRAATSLLPGLPSTRRHPRRRRTAWSGRCWPAWCCCPRRCWRSATPSGTTCERRAAGRRGLEVVRRHGGAVRRVVPLRAGGHRAARPQRRRQVHAVRPAGRLHRAEPGRRAGAGMDPRTEPAVHARLGLVPDGEGLWSFLTARQTVAFLARHRGVADPDAAARRALHTVGLDAAADRRVAGFSKGMRQRVRLAQALAHDPEVLLLDEPLNGLDPAQRRADVELVRRLGAEGRTVLVSSHILAEVERMADRVLVMVNGRLIAEGTPAGVQQLLAESARTIRVETDGPRRLAGLLLSDPSVDSVTVEDDHVLVHTTDGARLAGSAARAGPGRRAAPAAGHPGRRGPGERVQPADGLRRAGPAGTLLALSFRSVVRGKRLIGVVVLPLGRGRRGARPAADRGHPGPHRRVRGAGRQPAAAAGRRAGRAGARGERLRGRAGRGHARAAAGHDAGPAADRAGQVRRGGDGRVAGLPAGDAGLPGARHGDPAGAGHDRVEPAAVLALASAAYVALFTLLSLLLSRAVLVGLAYLVLWEGLLAGTAPAFRNLSVGAYGNRIAGAPWVDAPFPMADTSVLVAVLTLAAVTCAAVGAAAWRLPRTHV
jgi:ABC-type multidrug transport system ATPase subunit